MVGARVRRQQVAYARRRGLSSRRACAVLSVARSTLGYESRLRQRDAPALAVMRELAGPYPRYGYRKIRVFLARRGHPMSAQRAYRLWHQAGLHVPRRPPAPAGSLPPRATAGPDRDESRVGLRLRLRYVRGWPVAEVPDRRRRVHS